MTEQEAIQDLIDALKELEESNDQMIKELEELSKAIREISWN